MIPRQVLVSNLIDIARWSTRILPFVGVFQGSGLGLGLKEEAREAN